MSEKVKTIKEQFGIKIPKGNLYYPASGGDTVDALMYSIDAVNEAHFSDTSHVVIPYPECGVSYRINTNRVRIERTEAERKARGIIGRDIIKSATEILVNSANFNVSFNNTLSKYFDFNAAFIKPGFGVQVAEKWTLNEGESITSDIHIFAYNMDAVLTLMGLENISIFFYRCDSDGESGSEQYWFSPDLFNLVLYKMVDGGLIVTDGSNISPYPYRTDLPWSSFREHDKIVENFYYNGIRFEYIGKLDQSNDTHIWQIHKN